MLAKNIRFLRRQQKLSRQAVADRIGLKSQATIMHWECGHTEPTFLYFTRMADLFDVNMNQFYEQDLAALHAEGKPYHCQPEIVAQVHELPSVFCVPEETHALLKAKVMRQIEQLSPELLTELATWLAEHRERGEAAAID